MAPFSRLFNRGGHTGRKVASKPANTSIVSTAYATETARPTASQPRLPQFSRSISSNSNASDHQATARTPSSHPPSKSLEDLSADTNDVEALIIRTIKNGDAESLEPILATRGNEIHFTGAMVRAAKERYCGEEIVRLLLQHAKKQQEEAPVPGESKTWVDPAALLAVLELFDVKMETLVILNFWGQADVPLSTILRILGRSEQALEIMEIILRERSMTSGSAFRFTEGWLIAAAKNDTHGTELMSLILSEARSGDELRITGSVLEAAARNPRCAIEIFDLLFHERRDELAVTPKVILAACHNYKLATALAVLLPKLIRGKRFTVNEEMVKAMFEDDSLEPWQRELRRKFSKGPTSEDMMKQTVKNMIQGSENLLFTRKGLLALVTLEDTSVLECLLSEPGLRNQVNISPRMVEAAASSISGRETMEILLRERGKEIQINERVILAALRNTWYGRALALMQLFLQERAGEVRVTQRTLEAAASMETYGEPEVLNLLLSHVGDGFLVTTKMVENAVLQDYGGDEVLALLLRAGKHDIQISANLVKSAYDPSMHDFSQQKSLKMLLEDGHDLRISHEAALAFRRCGSLYVMSLLLEKLGHDEHVREAILIAAVSGDLDHEGILALIRSQPWESVTISERVILAANKPLFLFDKLGGVLKMLLEKYGNAVHIDDKAMMAIMQRCGTITVQPLLQKLGCSLRISSKFLESVAKNHKGCDVLRLLLRERGTEIRITQEVIDAATSNEYGGDDIILLLLVERREEIQITESLVEYAARASHKLWQWLIWNSGHDIQMTERVLEAVVSHHWYGFEMLQALLGVYGDDIEITERVLEAAARNAGNGIEILEVLLLERGDQICITERIMEAAAQNTKTGTEILELLLRERPDEADITERVVEAVASNEAIGDKVMDHILGKYGDDIAISERILERVCSNEKKGEEISAVILQKSGRYLVLTERVLETAAERDWRGANPVENFLAKEGSVVQMTSKVLEAVARCGCGGSMVTDLLERCSDRVQLTESAVEWCTQGETLDLHTRWDIVMEFVWKRFRDIQLTDRVIECLVARTWPSMMEKVLDEIGDEVQISLRMLEESAAGHDYRQAEIVGRLLGRTTGKIQVSQPMVEAAVENEQCGPKILELLLEERGDEFKVTEQIMINAARNPSKGAKIIDILLQDRGDSGEIQVNERLMEAAAGNTEWRRDNRSALASQQR